jgi:hypothetical protein
MHPAQFVGQFQKMGHPQSILPNKDESAFIESAMDISSHSDRVGHVVRYAIARQIQSVIVLAHAIFLEPIRLTPWTQMRPLEVVSVFGNCTTFVSRKNRR